ncbi:hypothetical protein ACLQ28_26075 [Micromonospora sp. DT201]|uniref:hypothetical protein n=1 Tax=Micromonospora sp. DT201 TaxID=3393442 RepID=UPI003CE7960D
MGKLERYFEDVAWIKAEGVSTNGWVTVIRDHDGDLKVAIRHGMLRRCSPDQVARQVWAVARLAVASPQPPRPDIETLRGERRP